MKMTGNTIFITGGGSGIGAGLASAFHKLGNEVIIGGRREDALRSVCEKYTGMSYHVLDVSDPSSVQQAASVLASKYPKLNCLINNAGISRAIDFNDNSHDLSSLGEEIDTNIKGLVFMTAAFVPVIKNNAHAAIINISSGLGFMPLARVPVYCSTKAAIHSLSMSLRHQLKASKIEVIEVAPPLVETGFYIPDGKNEGPKAMEVSEFSERAIKELASNRTEIAIGLAKMTRMGARIAPSRLFSAVNN